MNASNVHSVFISGLILSYRSIKKITNGFNADIWWSDHKIQLLVWYDRRERDTWSRIFNFFYATWLFSAQNATFSPAEVTSASDLSKTRQRTASAICGRRRELRVECTPATGVFNGKNGNRIVWANGFTLISLEIKRFAESSISQVEQHGDRLHFGMKLALKELIE